MEGKKLRIKIKDLPKDKKVSLEEMRKIWGGIDTVPLPERTFNYPYSTPQTSTIPPLTWNPVAMECMSRCRGFGI